MSIPFSWIYLIYDPYTKLYKIGKSDNPDARLKQLSSPSNYGTIPACPTQYHLLEAWLCPEETERGLHQVFADVRVRGEWFDLDKWASEGSVNFHLAPPTFAVHEDLEDQYFAEYIRWSDKTSRMSESYYDLIDREAERHNSMLSQNFITEAVQ